MNERKWLLIALLGIALSIPCALLFSQSAGAAFDCADTDGDGYPDSDATCTCTSVTLESSVSSSATTVTLGSYDGSNVYTCGQFVTGGPWVKAKGSPARVKIASYSPGPDSDGNGWDLNPVRIIAGGNPDVYQYVDGVGYGHPPTWPPPAIGAQEFQGWDTIVFGIKSRTGGSCGKAESKGQPSWKEPCLKLVTALTVIPSGTTVAPTKHFRPPYSGRWNAATSQRETWTKPLISTDSIDFTGRWTQRSCGACIPHSKVDLRDAWAQVFYDPVESFELRWMRPSDTWWSRSPNPVPDGEYGARWGVRSSANWEMLLQNIADPTTDPVGRQAIYNYIQAGIDFIYLAIEGDRVWWGDGGHGIGARAPAFMASYWVNTAGSNPSYVGNDYPELAAFWQSGISEEYFAEEQWINDTQTSRTYADLPGWNNDWSDTFRNDENTPVTLIGKHWEGPRKFNNTNRRGSNDLNVWESCGGSNSRDPYGYVDASLGSCWAEVMNGNCPATFGDNDYERMNRCPIQGNATIALLHPELHAFSAFPQALEYSIRMRYHGYIYHAGNGTTWEDDGHSEPQSGVLDLNGPRCEGKHNTHPGTYGSAPGKNCYESNGNVNNKQVHEFAQLYLETAPGSVPDPFTASVTCTPTSGNATLAVTCDPSLTQVGTGPNYVYEMDYDRDGSTDETITCTTATNPSAFASFNYTAPGAYLPKLTVTDYGADGTCTTSVSTTTANGPQIDVSSSGSFAFLNPDCGPDPIVNGGTATCSWSTTDTPTGCSVDEDGDSTFETSATSPHEFTLNGTDGETVTVGIQCTHATEPTITATFPIEVQDSVAVESASLWSNGPTPVLIEANFEDGRGVIDLAKIPKRCLTADGYGTDTFCPNGVGDCGAGETCDHCLVMEPIGNAALMADAGSVGMDWLLQGVQQRTRVVTPSNTLGVTCEGGDCGYGENGALPWCETTDPYGLPQAPGITTNGPQCGAIFSTPGVHTITFTAFDEDSCIGQPAGQPLSFGVHVYDGSLNRWVPYGEQ